MSDASFGPFFNEETFSSVKPLIENTSEVVQQVNGNLNQVLIAIKMC